MLREELLEIITSQNAQVSLEFFNPIKREKISLQAGIRLPSASLIKVPILLTVLGQVSSGQVSLRHRLRLSSKNAVEFSRITEMNQADFSVEELLYWMITVSDNAATNLLIDLIGMDKVNQLCQNLGLNATSLERKMMDFSAIEAGRQNWTSAADMMRLLEFLYAGAELYHRILSPEEKTLTPSQNDPTDLLQLFLRQDAEKNSSLQLDSFKLFHRLNALPLSPQTCYAALQIMKGTQDGSALLRYIPQKITLAHKTGELDHINHDMGIFFLPEKIYMVAICITRSQDNPQAQQLIGRLSKCIYDHMK